MKKLTHLLLCLLILSSSPLLSQSGEPDKAKPSFIVPVPSTTHHTLKLPGGKELEYTAIAGYTVLKTEEGKPRANVFSIAYTRSKSKLDTGDGAERPITFAFNGGPDSASVWLHMGALGPRRILMSDKGETLPPPYEVVDNEYSWLEFTDLVFIDPVMTGYSRPAEGVDKKEFTGYEEDVEYLSEFIRLYVSKNGRWNSPKYLAGESYGTTRAAGLAGRLQDRFGLYINGLVLVSNVTNFQTLEFDRGNDLPYPLFLPTYAATAWYHKKLSPEFASLPSLLREVEEFALNDYTLALAQGERLSAEQRKAIAARLARYTGLSEAYILQSNLRILDDRFTKQLRREEGITVGRLDSRFTGKDYDAVGERYEFDPSYSAAIYGPYTMAVNDHLKRKLRCDIELPYEILTGRVHPWNYGNVQNRYLNVAETLRSAMQRNQHLKVLILNGYYDLATPYFATQYTLDHLFLEENLRGNISMKYYEAGHMMYIHKPSLEQMTKDVRAFYPQKN